MIGSKLRRALDALTDERRSIVELRHGLDAHRQHGLPLRDVALLVGVSHEKVRQVERHALAELRASIGIPSVG